LVGEKNLVVILYFMHCRAHCLCLYAGGEGCRTYSKKEGILTGLVTSCVRTVFENKLLQEI